MENGTFDVTVLIRTLLRPSLPAAVRSVFAQDFPGRIQILIGADAVPGAAPIVDGLRAECPARMRLDLLDMPYATSERRGGIYPSQEGGSLAVLLAFAANARYIVYLDDDNQAAPDHIRLLHQAVQGFDWAFTLRWLVDGPTGNLLCADEWESVGPGKGVFAVRAGGFADPNCMIIDKLACAFCLPWFAFALYRNGTGADRLLFRCLAERHAVGWTGQPTLYYGIRPEDPLSRMRATWLAAKGIALPDWLAALAAEQS
jgi:hypothetical protein